ncbi:thioredoxin family protein [Jannaschia sp. W003]|uniref:thioredoxin family protein n=1 Tax=Jannaschia sp. W003 TaxID=2867012 RepID=UPI0021A836A0|nr:thioredoxin family protein [Jannaschia sp. W003]UWQ22407.1 thioredoxin family protein [Jannaschia sp. W003]
MRLLIAAVAALWAVAAPAAELGDDGLHKAPWMVETFKDLREDLAEANASGRRLLLIVEQRGCIYCTRMHEEVFPREDIARMLGEDYLVVQLNMFGDVEVTDFDGESMSEKAAVRRWGLNFTPTLLFLPEDVPEGATAGEAAVATMPGAFGAGTTRNLLQWVLERGYAGDEPFQAYHARKLGGG